MTIRAAFYVLLFGAVCRPPAAAGQCAPATCRPPETAHPAVVRVLSSGLDGSRNFGSGTLVHKDDRRGIVLTCDHLFRGGVQTVRVVFADGRPFDAVVVGADRAWDLAALEITRPEATPILLADNYPKPGDPLESCGYGRDGRYWCNRGRALGYARTASTRTYETLELSGYARQGDSGGPVLNVRGELVAVLWGTDGRTVDGTYCGRIRRFLAGIVSLGRSPPLRPIPPPGLPTPRPEQTTPPVPGDPLDKIRQRMDGMAGELEQVNRQRAEDRRSLSQQLEQIETAVASVTGLKGRVERAEAAVAEDSLRAKLRELAVGGAVREAPGLIELILPAVLVALGWTAPPSIAAILAVRLAARVLRRRSRRRNTGRVPDGDAPPKRLNDEYAEQLARVYALSGRSPVADATLGREYDQELRQAEQSSDGALGAWARKLRERVARRFYRIHGESPVPAEPTVA